MRYFLGLDLSLTNKLAIEKWREHALPAFEKPVPIANFHITLSFLGHVSETTLDMLCSQMDGADCAQFSITLNQMGYWAKPKILFLAPSSVPENLNLLAKTTQKIANNCQIDMKKTEYKPHVTLVRGLKSNPPCELLQPNIHCHFNDVHLFESVSGKHGVHYPIRKSWPLRPDFQF